MSRRRSVGKATLLAADQVISSAGNVLMPILIAGSTSSAQFGFFVVAYSAFGLLQAIARNTLSVHVSMASGSQQAVKTEVGLAVTVIALLGPLVISGVAAIPLIAGAQWQPFYFVFAVSGVAALGQDVLRFGAVARSRVYDVLVSDSIWLLVMLAAVLARLMGSDSSTMVVGLWGLGAVLAGVMLLPGSLIPCRPRNAFGLWAKQAHARSSLMIASLTSAGSVLAAAIIIARLAGPEVNAALGGAGQLMAPMNFLVALIGLGLMPLAARRSDAWARRAFGFAGGALWVIALLWGGLLLLVPNAVGELILGDTWEAARAVILPVTLTTGSVAAGAAGAALLVRLHNEPRMAFLRTAQSVTRIGVVTLVALTFGSAIAQATAEFVITGSFALAVWLVGARVSKTLSRTIDVEPRKRSPTPRRHRPQRGSSA